ncbi:MAG: apolipoprotein N-acyltransferase [Alteraurantiacibacter sp.]
MTYAAHPLLVFDSYPRRAWAWALGLGLLSASGFQPLGLWPLALVAAGIFVLLAFRAPDWKAALRLGWLFGWTHFTLANYWIATAFTYQAEMPAALGWAAVPLLAVYLAAYPALATLAAHLLAKQRSVWAFALVFAGAFVVAEWLRGWVFTGYAWNPFSMVLIGPFSRPGLAAIAPVMGTYAASGIALLIGAGLAILVAEQRYRVSLLVAALVLAGMYWPAAAPREGTLAVTLVQPDIFQETLNDPRSFESNYQKLARLTPRVPANGDGPRLVLWPESGMTDYLREGYPQRYYDRTTALGSPLFARRRLGEAIGEDSVLLTGAVDLEIGPDEFGYERALGARNAVTALSSDGQILGSYFKAELVPYGEYLPLRGLLEPLGLSRLVAGAIDFLPGPGPQTLDLGPQGRASVQVCYEIIFAGQVTDRADRPDYIFNPSNEDWFDASAKPQFLAQSRMRAIEEGLPVLRSTTTGISAVIDARGVVREHLGDHIPGRIDTRVPPAAPPTLFARLGNTLSLIWAALFIIAGIVAMRRRRR